MGFLFAVSGIIDLYTSGGAIAICQMKSGKKYQNLKRKFIIILYVFFQALIPFT